jgi:hypothetical protein
MGRAFCENAAREMGSFPPVLASSRHLTKRYLVFDPVDRHV